jgi:hypothetical protein
MRFWAIRVGHSLVPADSESLAEFEKLPFEKPLQVEAKQPRNHKHSRLFFKLCSRIGAGIGKSTEWVENAFKVETEHFIHYSYGGKDHIILQSIAFQNMDQIAFREFFERCIQITYERWHIDPASVADLLAPNEDQKRR